MTSMSTTTAIRCLSCRKGIYFSADIGTCKNCYVEEGGTVEKLTQEIDDLEAKVAFLRFWPPRSDGDGDTDAYTSASVPFPDVALVASGCADDSSGSPPQPIPAHKAILVNRSPVFKAMLENEMEESKSCTIKIRDASADALRAFVNYFYTAEAKMDDEKMGCDLLVLAEKYMVTHLKQDCEKFLSSQLDFENSLKGYAFARRQNAKQLLKSALSLILANMDKLIEREDYKELVEKDPRLVVEIYEAFLRSFQTRGSD